MKNNATKRYFDRAARHFLKLAVLMALLFGAMVATGTLAVMPQQLLGYRGVILLVAMVALSAAYPSYGYSAIRLQVSLTHDRELIEEAMRRSDYQLHHQEGDTLVFRSTSAWKRLVNVGNETITVRTEGSGIEICGVRKEVENVRFRLVGLLNNR